MKAKLAETEPRTKEQLDVADRVKVGPVRSAKEILASLNPTLYDLEPLGPWVVIRKRVRGESATPGGLVLAASDRSSIGEVVWAGSDMALNSGDLVIFSNFAMELKDTEELTGEEGLYLVRKEECYARLKPRPTPKCE